MENRKFHIPKMGREMKLNFQWTHSFLVDGYQWISMLENERGNYIYIWCGIRVQCVYVRKCRPLHSNICKFTFHLATISLITAFDFRFRLTKFKSEGCFVNTVMEHYQFILSSQILDMRKQNMTKLFQRHNFDCLNHQFRSRIYSHCYLFRLQLFPTDIDRDS